MSQPPSRAGTLVAGLLVVTAGTVIYLVAANIIPQPDEKFGAPRWLVALFGLSFFFAGWCILSLFLPAPRTGRLLATAAGLSLVTGGAVFLTWLAWTGGDGGRTTISIGPVSMLLPRGISLGIERVIIWFFALLNDGIAVVMWWSALRALVQRRAP